MGPFAKTDLKITEAGKERDSFILRTFHKSKFIKIRLTSSAGEDSDGIAKNFAKEYSRIVGQG
jgi:hypothetical protein